MTINIQNIPRALREHNAWCCWNYETRDGKPTKVPYNPLTGNRGDSSDRSTFGTFEQACFSKEMNGFDGIGIGIFDGLCAIDIDHCIEEGVFTDMANKVFETMNSYAEFSPSGDGLHIYFKAPGLQYDKAKYYIKHNGLEVYCSGVTSRFLTVTGNGIHNAGINSRGEELQHILDLFMRREVPKNRNLRTVYTPPALQVRLPDAGVIQRAISAKNGDLFKRLMAGDTAGYDEQDGGQNGADIALCNILAFWCNKDAAQMDRIFRTSALMRPKWDRPTAGSTYGAITIQDAISRVSDTYDDLRNRAQQPMPVKPPSRPRGDFYGW